MKYNLQQDHVLKAWKVYCKTKNISFAEALQKHGLSAKAEESMQENRKIRNMQQSITEKNTFC